MLVCLTDVTPLARAVHARLTAGDEPGAAGLLPVERPYPLPVEIAQVVGAGAD